MRKIFDVPFLGGIVLLRQFGGFEYYFIPAPQGLPPDSYILYGLFCRVSLFFTAVLVATMRASYR